MSLSNDMEFEYEGSALVATTDTTTDTTPVESRSMFALGRLPPQSVIFPSGEREPFWVVPKDGKSMDPIPADPILQALAMSQCNEFANGTVALVPAGYKEFIMVSAVWKRVRTANSEGVNVVTTERVIGPAMTFGGETNFLEVHQPRYTGGGNITTRLPDVNLQVPLSWVDAGMIPDLLDVPAFTSERGLPHKLSIIIIVSVDGGEPKIYKGPQFNTWTKNHSITTRQLAVYAAGVVTTLMNQARGERSILCVNNIEIDSDDVFLDKLEQISQGSFCLKIAVRDFQLPAGLPVVNALQARIP